MSGHVGVCVATSGPGAAHLVNGLYDAQLDHVPVVAIVGQTARSAMGGSYRQEVDPRTLFKDVASAYQETVTVPEQLPNVPAPTPRAPGARRWRRTDPGSWTSAPTPPLQPLPRGPGCR